MDLERRRLGNGSLDFPNRLASQSLKDAQNAGYNMYEDHSDNRKRSPLLHKILYGTTMHIASLNAHRISKCLLPFEEHHAPPNHPVHAKERY